MDNETSNALGKALQFAYEHVAPILLIIGSLGGGLVWVAKRMFATREAVEAYMEENRKEHKELAKSVQDCTADLKEDQRRSSEKTLLLMLELHGKKPEDVNIDIEEDKW